MAADVWGWFGNRSSGEGQEFETAASAANWGWFGNRSSGEGLEFSTAAVAWTDQAWLRGGQFIMAAEVGAGTITGTLSITFDGQTVAGDGDLLINGVLAQSFGSMTLAGAGDLDIVAQSSVTFAGQTLAGVGDLDITGALSVTFGGMTASADSDLIIQGTQGGQLGDMTLAGVGQLSIAGAIAATFGDMSLAGEGSSTSIIIGVSDISFDGMTLVSIGAVLAQEIVGGGGGGGGGNVTRLKYKPKIRKKPYAFLDDMGIEEIYEELISDKETQSEVKKLVKPYVKNQEIDFDRLLENVEKIEQLLALYRELQQAQEDEDILLLLMCG